ncbi:MAG TPA: permease-like cell division protein FtsX [Fibrobacteraceae bacterium]|nr:permease-like cell division protein FtsX [Fibrobacteraceae bacterium]
MLEGNLAILDKVRGQIPYLVSEAFRSWRQHRTVVAPSLVTIFLCSFLLAGSLSVLCGAVRAISHRDAFYEIEAFLVENPSPKQLDSLRHKALAIKAVQSVRLISPEQAKEEFIASFGDAMLAQVDSNPLPASIRITLQQQYRDPADLAQVIHVLERMEVFDMVQAPQTWAAWLERWRFEMLFWPLLISILLLLTLGLIIGNAVRLTLFSRKLLVENMKYAGGSFFFIQFPFVLEGFMQGMLGSLAAAILWGLVCWMMQSHFPALIPYLVDQKSIVALIVVLVSAVGAYSSYRSVRSFLRASW